jgi:pilus assembly protein FimV
VKLEPEVEPEPEVESDTEVKLEPEVEPEPEVESDTEVKLEPEVEPEPEVESDTEVKLEPEVELDLSIDVTTLPDPTEDEEIILFEAPEPVKKTEENEDVVEDKTNSVKSEEDLVQITSVEEEGETFMMIDAEILDPPQPIETKPAESCLLM